MFEALIDGDVRLGGSFEGCPADDRAWFWYELERWPDPEVTNGPRMNSPSSHDAYRTLRAVRKGDGARRRCVLDVWVKDRRVLGATVAEPSGNVVIDDLARRLYPPPEPDLSGAEAFRVTVYAHDPSAEQTFSYDP